MKSQRRRMRLGLRCLPVLATWLVQCTVQAQDPQDLDQVLARVQMINTRLANAGRLAAARSSDDAVRDYGERLWRDHRFANRRVRKFAEDHRVVVGVYRPPTRRVRFQMQIAQQYMRLLHHLRDTAFDRTFLDLMRSMHRTAVAELRTVAMQTRSEALRALLRELVPIYRQHSVLARLLQDRDKKRGRSP